MKRVYILRGLPGSGKSTLARWLAPGSTVYSTDYLFIRDGVYCFDGTKLAEYHEKNQQDFRFGAKQGIEPLVVDNTNLSHREMEPYRQAAREHGYEVVEVLVGDPRDPEHQRVCAERNQHGVSLKAIEKMARRFQR